MMKTWKKPEVSKANQELVEMNENEMNEVNGGWKIGACAIVGAGGDMTKLRSGIFLGICYIVGV